LNGLSKPYFQPLRVDRTGRFRVSRVVLRLQGVGAGFEDVGDGALVDEHRHLALAHDQVGVHLDLVLVAWEAPDDRVPGVVGPLDDVDELAADLVHQSHDAVLLSQVWAPAVRRGPSWTLPCTHGGGEGR
jgi:hypothetical protein